MDPEAYGLGEERATSGEVPATEAEWRKVVLPTTPL